MVLIFTAKPIITSISNFPYSDYDLIEGTHTEHANNEEVLDDIDEEFFFQELVSYITLNQAKRIIYFENSYILSIIQLEPFIPPPNQ